MISRNFIMFQDDDDESDRDDLEFAKMLTEFIKLSDTPKHYEIN